MKNGRGVVLISPITDDVYERLSPICDYLEKRHGPVLVGLFDLYGRRYATDEIERKFKQQGYDVQVFSSATQGISFLKRSSTSFYLLTFRHNHIQYKLISLLFLYFLLPSPKFLARSNLLLVRCVLGKTSSKRKELFASILTIIKNIFLHAGFCLQNYLAYYFFFMPFLWLSTRKRVLILPTEPGKILFIRMDHLGDIICTLPSLQALRERFPRSHITFLCASWSKAPLEAVPYLYDELLVWDAPWHNKPTNYRSGLAPIIKFLRFLPQIRRKNFDLVIQPRGDGMNVILAALSGSKHIVSGIDGKRPMARLVSRYIDQPIVHSPYRTYHIAEWPILCLEALGINNAKKSVASVSYPIKHMEAVRIAMTPWKNDNFTLCAVIIGAGSKVREWEPTRFAYILKWLYDRKVITILIGSQSEILTRDAILDNLSDVSVIDLVGKTDFENLGYVLKISDFVFTLDTSVMHLASLLGRDIVAIFSSGNINLAKPFFHENFQIVKKELGCSGCGDQCFLKNPCCITRVRVEDAERALDHVLRRRPPFTSPPGTQ